jgi:hypothetical protein
VCEQKPSDTCSATVGPNDHAQHPRRAVAAFLDVELTETYRTQCSILVARDPRPGKPAAAGLANRDSMPPLTVDGFRSMSPLQPAKIGHRLNASLPQQSSEPFSLSPASQ